MVAAAALALVAVVGGGLAVRALGDDAQAADAPRRVVETVYADVDPVLWGAAELSVRAQIDYLRG